MSKILISDFYGTLISSNPAGMEYFYSKGSNLRSILELYNDKCYYNELINRAFKHLSRFLNEFLSNGNYLKIVTSMDAHDRLDFILDELLCRFYEPIKKYRDQIAIFLASGAGNKPEIGELSKRSKISQADNCFYVQDKTGLSFYIINHKTDVFDFVTKEHDLKTNQLFTIGDSRYDIPMLFKGIELGGKSSLINHYMYRIDGIDTESIVKSLVSLNRQIMLEDLVNIKYPDFKSYNESKQMDIMEELIKELCESQQMNKWTYNEYHKIYEALKNGEYDLNDLLKKVMIFEVIRNYNFIVDKNYGPIKSKRTEELSIYPTFNDYYTKVLKR